MTVTGGVILGVIIGGAVMLAILVVPVDRLPLVSGSVSVAAGVFVLVFGTLVEMGVVSTLDGYRPPWPLAVLGAMLGAALIYQGVQQIREGWPDRDPP